LPRIAPPPQVPRAGDKKNYHPCRFCLLPFEPTKDLAPQTDSVRASHLTNLEPLWDPLRTSVFLLSTLARPRSLSLSLFRERRPESRPWFRCWNYYLFVSVSELSNILVLLGFFFGVLLWCTCFVCLRNFEKKRSKTAWCERKKKRRCYRGCSWVFWRSSFRETSVLAIFLSQWSSIPLRYVSIMPTSTFWGSVVLKVVEERQRNLHLSLQI